MESVAFYLGEVKKGDMQNHPTSNQYIDIGIAGLVCYSQEGKEVPK